MDFEKCILILKRAIQELNINMYPLQGEANTESILDLLTQIDDEIGKTPKPRTNFDKITESVENLAFVLSYSTDCASCSAKEGKRCYIEKGTKKCIEQIKEWLQKEIDDE